jgi:hypothetical protein
LFDPQFRFIGLLYQENQGFIETLLLAKYQRLSFYISMSNSEKARNEQKFIAMRMIIIESLTKLP